VGHRGSRRHRIENLVNPSVMAGLTADHLVFQVRGAPSAETIVARKTDLGFYTNHLVSIGDVYWYDGMRIEVTRVEYKNEGLVCFR
jgi:hypothetical protein